MKLFVFLNAFEPSERSSLCLTTQKVLMWSENETTARWKHTHTCRICAYIWPQIHTRMAKIHFHTYTLKHTRHIGNIWSWSRLEVKPQSWRWTKAEGDRSRQSQLSLSLACSASLNPPTPPKFTTMTLRKNHRLSSPALWGVGSSAPKSNQWHW